MGWLHGELHRRTYLTRYASMQPNSISESGDASHNIAASNAPLPLAPGNETFSLIQVPAILHGVSRPGFKSSITGAPVKLWRSSVFHPERVTELVWYPFRVPNFVPTFSCGLRFAAPPGYFLATLSGCETFI